MTAEINSFKTYPDARQHQQDQLRQNIVNAACLLLTEEGIEALTVRNVAQKLECSTKIVYSMFGSKEKLVNEMFKEGCHILSQSITNIPSSEDARIYLNGVGEAYWEFASNNPGYYRLMFAGELQDFKPDENSKIETMNSLTLIINTLQRFSDEGKIKLTDPLTATLIMKAALHGVLHLALIGHITDEKETKNLFDATLQSLITAFLP